MLAGYALDQSVQCALAETGAERSGTSVNYALVDSTLTRMQIVMHGPRVALVRVKDGVGVPLQPIPALEAAAQHMDLRAGEALLFVAHRSLWKRHLLNGIDRCLLDAQESWNEQTALELCGRVPAVLEGDSASALLFRAAEPPALADLSYR
jgi:hypothetical protein